jgi:hypothetical protein
VECTNPSIVLKGTPLTCNLPYRNAAELEVRAAAFLADLWLFVCNCVCLPVKVALQPQQVGAAVQSHLIQGLACAVVCLPLICTAPAGCWCPLQRTCFCTH